MTTKPHTPGLTFTAMDMGRALFQSDVWPIRGKSIPRGADICSYITRVLFGRNLMMGRGPIRVDLENGHHLLITMRANNDPAPGAITVKLDASDVAAEVTKLLEERSRAYAMLQELVEDDRQVNAARCQAYATGSPRAKMWARARKLLKALS